MGEELAHQQTDLEEIVPSKFNPLLHITPTPPQSVNRQISCISCGSFSVKVLQTATCDNTYECELISEDTNSEPVIVAHTDTLNEYCSDISRFQLYCSDCEYNFHPIYAVEFE
jgi:hypothetical protein